MHMEAEKKTVGMHAVIVGCNYRDKEAKLGCHNDAYKMRKTLIERFRFDPKRISVMVDKPGSGKMPTGANIKNELQDMIGKARAGDSLFFFFSGHGVCYTEPAHRRKHAITASDGNLITHMDLRYYVNRLPKNATLTVFADSCCAGGLIDKEPVQVGAPAAAYGVLDEDDDDHADQTADEDCDKANKMISYESYLADLSSKTGLNDPDIGVHLLHLFKSDASISFRLPINEHPKALKADQGILLSGCEPHESGYTDRDEKGARCGAFTKTVVRILNRRAGSITNRDLVSRARAILEKSKPYVQHPCLYCSPKNADAVFLRRPFSRAEIGEASSQDINQESEDQLA